MFERGRIVLVPFPFTDLRSQKVRPAVIVSLGRSPQNDVVVAFVSSVISKSPQIVPVPKTHPAFKTTGLKVSSVIRCDKLATLDCRIVLGEIGTLPTPLRRQMDSCLRRALGL